MYTLCQTRQPSGVKVQFADWDTSASFTRKWEVWFPPVSELGLPVKYDDNTIFINPEEAVFTTSKVTFGSYRTVKHKTLWHGQFKGDGLIPEYVFADDSKVFTARNRYQSINDPAITMANESWRSYAWTTWGSSWFVLWARPIVHRSNYSLVQVLTYRHQSGNQNDVRFRVHCVSPYVSKTSLENKAWSDGNGWYRVKEDFTLSELSAMSSPPPFTIKSSGLPFNLDDVGQEITVADNSIETNWHISQYPGFWPLNGDWYPYGNGVEPGPTIDQVHEQLGSLMTWLTQHGSQIDPNKDEIFGQLCNDAISTSYCNDSNALEFWKDIPKFGGEIKELSKALLTTLSTAGWRKTTKDVSKAYLASHYGTNLTLSDSQKWANAVTEWMWRDRTDHCRLVHSRRTVEVTSWTPLLGDGIALYNYSLYYDPHWDHRTLKELATEMGLRPTAKNVWEVIPYSFVVDWFYNITDQLEAVTSGQRLIELDVLGQETSYHYSFPVKAAKGLVLDFYVRIPERQATIYPLPTPSKSQWKSHWLEGLTLILSH